MIVSNPAGSEPNGPNTTQTIPDRSNPIRDRLGCGYIGSCFRIRWSGFGCFGGNRTASTGRNSFVCVLRARKRGAASPFPTALNFYDAPSSCGARILLKRFDCSSKHAAAATGCLLRGLQAHYESLSTDRAQHKTLPF